MMTRTPYTGRVLANRYSVGKLRDSNAAGEWYDAENVITSQGNGLPTEFASASTLTPRRVTLIIRPLAASEPVSIDAVGIRHPFLVNVSHAEVATDVDGQRVLMQITDFAAQTMTAACQIEQVASEWRQIASAAASGLAHLHALGKFHGAVRLNNVVRAEGSGANWRLGPTRCTGNLDRLDDLKSLAEMIGIELKSHVRPEQRHSLDELAELCCIKGVEAAHVALSAQQGCLYGPSQSDTPLDKPSWARTTTGIRVSANSLGRIVFLGCAPHRLPREGAVVPETHLEHLGTSLHSLKAGEAVMTAPTSATAVFCAILSDGLARIGGHVVPEPAAREWGRLSADFHPDGLRLQWFWPTDISCKNMRVQFRPDHYPEFATDPRASAESCYRMVYDSKGHWLLPIPDAWDRVFIRVSRTDKPESEDAHAVFGTALRTEFKAVSLPRFWHHWELFRTRVLGATEFKAASRPQFWHSLVRRAASHP